MSQPSFEAHTRQALNHILQLLQNPATCCICCSNRGTHRPGVSMCIAQHGHEKHAYAVKPAIWAAITTGNMRTCSTFIQDVPTKVTRAMAESFKLSVHLLMPVKAES